MSARGWFRALVACWCTLLLACAGGIRPETLPKFESIEEQFKYGSVGIESEEGIPYWIWQVLPRVFADKLPRPGGYAAFGFLWEPGKELPVGFSKVDLYGGPRVAINCAFCHTSSVRTSELAPPRIVAAGPGKPDQPAGVCEVPAGRRSTIRGSMPTSSSRRSAASPAYRGGSACSTATC